MKAPWISKINDIEIELSCLPPGTLIGSAKLQAVLGIGPRLAQELLQPIVTEHKGKAGLAPVEAVLMELRRLAGQNPEEETERRRKFAGWLEKEQQRVKERPMLLIEAPLAITGSQLDTIPGLELGPGYLTLRFRTPEEAKLKLLALAMAIAREQEEFDERVKDAGQKAS